jgi:hypothetical protein
VAELRPLLRTLAALDAADADERDAEGMETALDQLRAGLTEAAHAAATR